MRLNITKSIGSLLPGTKSFQLMQQLKFMCHHGIIHGVSTNPGRGDSPHDAWWISPYKWLLVFDKRTINRCCCWRVTQGRVGWIPVNLWVKILAPYPKNSWSMDATFPPHISKFMDIHGNFIGILTNYFDPSHLVLRCQQMCFLLATSQEPRGYRVEMVHGSAWSVTRAARGHSFNGGE